MIKKFRSAIILCGGRGTRLGSVGKKFPKTLIKIQGREILWYIIHILKKNKFNHIILPLGYKGKMIENFLKRNKYFNISIETINTGINSNIGKRIFKVMSLIKSENFLLLNGDAIFNFNLNKSYENHFNKNYDLTFLSGKNRYPFGTIGIKNNKIVDFKRDLVFDILKIRGAKDYQAFNFTGMSIISKKILFKCKNIFKNSVNFEQIFYPFVIKNFKSSLDYINGKWYSIDNVKDLVVLNNKKINLGSYKDINKIKKIITKKNNY